MKPAPPSHRTQVFIFLLAILLVAGGICSVQSQQTSERPTFRQNRAKDGAPAESRPGRKEKPQISAKQAEEMFRKLDEVLEFVSDDSKLPIRHAIKKKLASRDEVEERARQQQKDEENAQRLQRSEVVLKKFRFVPQDFDLSAYMVRLLREQVAGFYSLKDKTVYMMDWIPEEQQMAIMSHELTHALQDQTVDLKTWLEHGPHGEDGAAKAKDKSAEKTADPDEEISQDEAVMAREAVTEGQGMVVMIDYVLRHSGKNNLTDPAFVANLRADMMAASGSPVLNQAPLYLQEFLEFPYSYGLEFVRELQLKGGKRLAYEDVLEHPPVNSREIMEPQSYLNGEKQEPMHLPDMKKLLGKDYERYDVGSVGEFDVSVLLEQFSGEKISLKLAPEWRGGAYYAARTVYNDKSPAGSETKTRSKNEEPSTADIALLYLSRWASPDAAQRFAGEYAKSLAKRYKSAQNVKAESGRQGMRWMTDEGLVVIEALGNQVLVLESFDAAIAEKLRAAVFVGSAQPRALRLRSGQALVPHGLYNFRFAFQAQEN